MATFAIAPCDHLRSRMKDWYEASRQHHRPYVGGYDTGREAQEPLENYDSWLEECRRRDRLRAVARALFEGGRAVVRESEYAVAEDLSLEERFREQSDQWARETEHLSSPTQMMMHPSYQAVLGLAREDERKVITLMLRDLRDNRRPWFWALSYLTKENPIEPPHVGRVDKMIRAWTDWGKRRGLL